MRSPNLVAEDVAEAFAAVSAKFLGAGTFGETWRVQDVDIQGELHPCAVKFLDPANFHPGLVRREIAGLSEVTSRRILQLHEVREVKVGSQPLTALVCEYIPGGDVAANLREFGPPGEADAIDFAIELIHAVKQLHRVDRIHRDLKLENVMLRDGRWDSPVIIDLGLSKSATEATMTRYPTRVGSLLFMAPEQLRGERARKTSDLWACGVILFSILEGRHPYVTTLAGKSEDDIADEITGPPPAISATRDNVLREVVARLLSEDAFERGTAKRALRDLRRARS